MSLREITEVVRTGPTHAVIFGRDWNATITASAHVLDRFIKPGAIVDIVKGKVA